MLALQTAEELCQTLASHLVILRKSQKMTQADLAARSGVSLGSLRRFEQRGEISLGPLMQMLIVLGAAEALVEGLAARGSDFRSIADVIERGKAS